MISDHNRTVKSGKGSSSMADFAISPDVFKGEKKRVSIPLDSPCARNCKIVKFNPSCDFSDIDSNKPMLVCSEDKENIRGNVGTNIDFSSSLSQTKKLSMTDAEKAMDGAPQGEIFDVTVAFDEEIAPSESPKEEIHAALLCLSNSESTWADKHSAVESMRRMMLHHSSEIIDTPGCIALIITAAVEAVASLRSSTSRNAILCLKQFIESQERFNLSTDQISAIILSLMNRTAIGPKFVAECAYAVCDNAINFVNFLDLFEILKPISWHKNADTSSKSYTLISRSFLHMEQFSSADSFRATINEYLFELVSFFGIGLTSKRAEGKQQSRKALLTLKNSVGSERFSEVVLMIPSQMSQAVIKKEVCRTVRERSAGLIRRKHVSCKGKSRLTELFSKTELVERHHGNEPGTTVMNEADSSFSPSLSSVEKLQDASQRRGHAAIINIPSSNDEETFIM